MNYTLSEAARVLEISDRQFRRWLGEVPHLAKYDTTDQRRRLLSQEQLRWLAEKHGRKVPDPGVAETLRSANVEVLAGVIESLARRVEELKKDLVDANVALSTLRDWVNEDSARDEMAMDGMANRLEAIETVLIQARLLVRAPQSSTQRSEPKHGQDVG